MTRIPKLSRFWPYLIVRHVALTLIVAALVTAFIGLIDYYSDPKVSPYSIVLVILLPALATGKAWIKRFDHIPRTWRLTAKLSAAVVLANLALCFGIWELVFWVLSGRSFTGGIFSTTEYFGMIWLPFVVVFALWAIVWGLIALGTTFRTWDD